MSNKISNAYLLNHARQAYQYQWPTEDILLNPAWTSIEGKNLRVMELQENLDNLKDNSKWPSLFPSPICIVTTRTSDGCIGIEKVVGPSIVNRFPFVIALSFCQQTLSPRHYARDKFTSILNKAKSVAIQFISPGETLNKIMSAIQDIPDDKIEERIKNLNIPIRNGLKTNAPIFEEAYLAYEAQLVSPQKDFSGIPIYDSYHKDLGSHKVYFFEITTIQLAKDIANGKNRIHWRSLPNWKATRQFAKKERENIKEIKNTETEILSRLKYKKSYTPDYIFPSDNTIAFKRDNDIHNMAVRHLPPLPKDQVEVDNDLARWPSFFPSSLGLITAWAKNGHPTALPCGSTTVLSRHPFTIAICLSYANINERYARRDSLDIILKRGWFGCGVPILTDQIIEAISYLGNVSYRHDSNKFYNSGLSLKEAGESPIVAELPIHFDCCVSDTVRLGTHIMILGQVKRIFIRDDVSIQNPIIWCPWAEVMKGSF